MILDMTHLADESFWEAAELFDGPLASRNNCRTLVPGDRQFDDDQIRFLIGRGGVIGTVLDIWMLAPGWSSANASQFNITLDAVIDHIDHICQLAGGTANVGIGSDLDGGYGKEQSPADLDSIADVQKIAPLLRGRACSDSDVAAILSGNWLRFLERAWSKNRADA